SAARPPPSPRGPAWSWTAGCSAARPARAEPGGVCPRPSAVSSRRDRPRRWTVDELDFGPQLPKDVPFTVEEYRERVHRLRQAIGPAGLDALVLHHFPSVYYLTGLQNLHVYDHDCVIVPAEGEIALIVPRSERTRALYTTWLDPQRV